MFRENAETGLASTSARFRRSRIGNRENFNSRSNAGKKKLRYFGRFIKSQDFKDKVISDAQIIKNNQEIQDVIEKRDYNLHVDLITQDPSQIK